MLDTKPNSETKEEFQLSLDSYTVGTVDNPLETDKYTLQIENGYLVSYKKTSGRREFIIPFGDLSYKISLFAVSPDQTKLVALQSPGDNKYHNGFWISDLVKKSDEFKNNWEYFIGNLTYTHLAISNRRTIAFGNNEVIYLHQCADPEKSFPEHKISTIFLSSSYDRKLFSLKFNKQGTLLGYKDISAKNSDSYSTHLVATGIHEDDEENNTDGIAPIEMNEPKQSTILPVIAVKQAQKAKNKQKCGIS